MCMQPSSAEPGVARLQRRFYGMGDVQFRLHAERLAVAEAEASLHITGKARQKVRVSLTPQHTLHAPTLDAHHRQPARMHRVSPTLDYLYNGVAPDGAGYTSQRGALPVGEPQPTRTDLNVKVAKDLERPWLLNQEKCDPLVARSREFLWYRHWNTHAAPGEEAMAARGTDDHGEWSGTTCLPHPHLGFSATQHLLF